MKKLALILVSALLVVSCAKSSNVTKNTDPTVALGSSDLSFDDAYSDVSSTYKDDPTMNVCMINSMNTCLNQTVTEKARTKNDENICDDLSDPNAVEFCKQGIVLSKIEKTGNIALCDSLKTNKENCIVQAALSQAVQKKDVKICDAIKIPETTSSGDISRASLISSKENCINQTLFTMAMSSQNEENCDKISNIEQKNMCHSSVKSQREMNKNIALPTENPVSAGVPISAKEAPIKKKKS